MRHSFLQKKPMEKPPSDAHENQKREECVLVVPPLI
jgi:hypothetical protein